MNLKIGDRVDMGNGELGTPIFAIIVQALSGVEPSKIFPSGRAAKVLFYDYDAMKSGHALCPVEYVKTFMVGQE